MREQSRRERREKLKQAGEKGKEQSKSNPRRLKGEHLSLVGYLAF